MEPEYEYLHLFDCQAVLFLLAGISGGIQFNGYSGYLMEEQPFFDQVQAGVYYTVGFRPYSEYLHAWYQINLNVN